MSRKSRIGEDEKANWSTIKHWTLTRSYSEYRPLDKVPKGTLVIVTHRRGGGDEGANHPLMLAAPALQRLKPFPSLVVLLDLSGAAPEGPHTLRFPGVIF